MPDTNGFADDEGKATGALVLVVDDDETNLEMVARILEHHGMDVRSATSLSQARECLHGDLPDLAILDIYLEDGSGIQLGQELKAREPNLPVIIMTGLPRAENLTQALAIDVDSYMIKPMNASKLLGLAEELIQGRKGKK